MPSMIPAMPLPDSADAARWEHTRKREQMLDGDWRSLLEEAIRTHLGATRARAMGPVDMSSNVLRAVATQLAVMYDRAPTVTNPGAADAAAPLVESGSGLLEQAGIWQVMGHVQRSVIGLNDALVAVEAASEGPPLLRYVSPAMVTGRAHHSAPDVPVMIRELRLRSHPTSGDLLWAWDIWDADPENPRFVIQTADDTASDITHWFARGMDGEPLEGMQEGDAYPYRDSSGAPVLPYVLYHANRAPRLFSPMNNRELFEGSLSAAVGWSFWAHCLKDASWPQRWAINCMPAGLAVTDTEGARRNAVVTDPATVLLLDVVEQGEGQPTVGQWQAGSDPGKLAECLMEYEARLATHFGVSPSDIQRDGGTPRSGYAISISQSGKREAQQRYEPNFRRGDLQLISTIATVLNNAQGTSFPEAGYEITYSGVPRSPQERDAARRHVLELLDAGLIDRVEALMQLNPGLTRDEATLRIDAIRRVNDSTRPM